MNRKHQTWKRFLASILVVMMVFTQSGFITFAEEGAQSEAESIVSEAPEQEAPAESAPTEAPAPESTPEEVQPTPVAEEPSPAAEEPAQNEEPKESEEIAPAESIAPASEAPASEQPAENDSDSDSNSDTDSNTESAPPSTESVAEDSSYEIGTSFTYVSADQSLRIEVAAPVEAQIPADAVFHADFLVPGSDAYNSAISVIQDKKGNELTGGAADAHFDYVLYDFYFTSETVPGDIQPKNDAELKITLHMDPAEDFGDAQKAAAKEAEQTAAAEAAAANVNSLVGELPDVSDGSFYVAAPEVVSGTTSASADSVSPVYTSKEAVVVHIKSENSDVEILRSNLNYSPRYGDGG